MRLNHYVDSLRWMSKEDRKELKQEGLKCIWERAKKDEPTSVKFAVKDQLRAILRRQKVRSLGAMEYDVSDPMNEYPDDVVIWILELPFDERSEYLGELARMEWSTPKRLGDLIAYIARTKVFKKATMGDKEEPEELLSAQEDFIKSFEYRFPRATRHALESLHLEQNTLSHRVRYHFRENWKW